MNTTVSGDVNMYSPHIGQSQSVERSMHLCEVAMEIDMQTQHVYPISQHSHLPGEWATRLHTLQ